MKRIVSCLVAVVALAVSSVPASAQASAAAPAPKVTINGLIDFVSTAYKNLQDLDITDGGKDSGWYSRERGLFTLTGEVGRSKGVLALEMDFLNGRAANAGQRGPASGASFDIETDERGQIEVKWLYLETLVTGPDSLLPFIPVPTLGRLGAQPARGHDYKPGIQFIGDFPGVSLESFWAPNVRSRLTYVQIDEALDPVNNSGGTEDWAVLASIEVDVFKGLTVKPTYSYARYDGGNDGTGNFGTFPRGGFNPNFRDAILASVGLTNPAAANKAQVRHTLGGDVRWTFGPWSLAPTFLYQWGTQEVASALITGTTGTQTVDIRSWIFDVIGGYRSGPLTVEGRFMWTPGMAANQCVQTTAVCAGGSDIGYYQPINTGTIIYFAGWSEIEAAGVDYETPLHDGLVNSSTLGANPSYDKYGRIIAAVATDYAFTPALIGHLIALAQWTDQAVDTNGLRALTSSGIVPVSRGDDRYLGTELDAGFTYRFAPNVAFDMMGAVLFVGPARDNARTAGGPRKDADDVYKLAARVRFTW